MPQNFNVPANEMLEDARTMRLLFLQDKADFVAIDPDFADPFEADWLAAIVRGESVESAENRLDRQMQETQDVIEAMRQGTRVYVTCKYYIEKAFADKPDTRNSLVPAGSPPRDPAQAKKINALALKQTPVL